MVRGFREGIRDKDRERAGKVVVDVLWYRYCISSV